MLRKKSESIEWLEFEQLQGFPVIRHGIFLRSGEAEFFLHSKLEPEKAEVNRMHARALIGCEAFIQGNQCHGKEVVAVSTPWQALSCDGLITHEENLGLLIKHADCQSALFYDPPHAVIANVHAGWRGMVHNIYKETIEVMGKKYGTHTADLLVCISPSLGPCCAEFKHYREEFPEPFWEYQERENYFNLWELAQKQLQACGILATHIEIAKMCTVCEARDFYSYRRDKIMGLNNGTVIAKCRC